MSEKKHERVLLAYSDLAAVTGTWHAPAYYAANRATLTAAIRRFWKECGGVTVWRAGAVSCRL